MGNNTICLKNNSGKIWHNFLSGNIKGFAYDSENNFLEGEVLYEQVLYQWKQDTLTQFLNQLDGNFALVIEQDNKLLLIVDRLRSYPLFYSVNGNSQVVVSDIGNDLIPYLKNSTELNEDAVYELLALGYLSGRDTLLRKVCSVEAGSYVVITDDEVDVFTYASYVSLIKDTKVLSVKKQAARILEEGFKKTVENIKGRPVLIPLSGGYDSRLIACLCKKFGLLDVTCFTYGRRDSFEVEISKKVARQLGFEWYFVEYTFDLWQYYIESRELKDYCLFSGNLTANPHFQDFPALAELKRLGVLRKDMVVLPGHSGDLLGGSKIPVSFLENRKMQLDRSSLSRLIYNEFYNLNVLNFKNRDKLISRIFYSIGNEKFNNSDEFLDCYETWFIKAKISNFLVNSMRGYEYWGLDWRLPLWDMNYERLWYSIPWKEKYYSILYNEFMFEYYFEEWGVAWKKSKGAMNTGVANRLKRVLPTVLSENLRKYIKKVRKLKSQKNVNAFDDVSRLLYEKIDPCKYSVVKSIKKDNINAVLAYVYLELIEKE